MNKQNYLSTFSSRDPNTGRVRLNGDILAKYGIATGIATTAFSIIGAKTGWLDKELAAKIGLSGLGVTCISSIPFIAKEVDESKVANTILNTAKGAFALGGN